MHKYQTISDFLQDQNSEKLEQINLVRKLILNSEPTLEENIKWNAPNYVFKGEDRITFNVINKENKVKLILHMGASKKEDKKSKPVLSNDYGIVDWKSNIRGSISFDNLEDIKTKADSLTKIVPDWLLLSA